MDDFPDGFTYTPRVQIAPGVDPASNRYGWTWVDISSYVLPTGIDIEVGRQNEQAEIGPAKASLELDNGDGRFTSNLATSPYYPNLEVGTPIRCFVDLPDTLKPYVITDTFTRTIASGWGIADSGHTWIFYDAPEDVAYSVSSGVGLLTVDPAYYVLEHWQYIDTRISDFEARFTISPAQAITGGAGWVAASFLYRGNLNFDVNSGNRFQVRFKQSGGMDVAFVVDGATSVVGAGITYAANDIFEVRVRIEEGVHRARVWKQGTAEPGTWTHTYSSTSGPTNGQVGLGIEAASSWTNATINLKYDNLTVEQIQPRIFGHIAAIELEWPFGDTDVAVVDNDITSRPECIAHIEIAGEFRRLGRSASVQLSAYTRGIRRRDPVVRAYWSLEETGSPTEAAAGIPGILPMQFSGDITWAKESGFYPSSPLPTVGAAGGFFKGTIPSYTATGFVRTPFFFRIPTAVSVNTPLITFECVGGTIKTWKLWLNSSGEYWVTAQDFVDTTVFTGSVTGPSIVGPYFILWIYLIQQGANIDVEVGRFDTNSGATSAFTENILAQTIGSISTIQLASSGFDYKNAAFGHPTAISDSDWFDIVPFFTAWDLETATNRIERLCNEESIPIINWGNPADQPLGATVMGPQTPEQILELMQECALADSGLLYEARDGGVVYRPRYHMYNQTMSMRLAADAGFGDITGSPRIIVDDEALINDATVTRKAGGSARVIDADSIAKKGLYEATETLNIDVTELDNAAEWLLYLGTNSFVRYSEIAPATIIRPDLVAQWVVKNLGDVLSITGLPVQYPSDAIRLLIQGYHETITPTLWEVDINGTLAEPWTLAYVAEGSSIETPTRADASSSTFPSAITSIATSLSVGTSSGPLWIQTATNPTEFPLLITFGGEVAQLIAVSGASSPQTFTVVRSINGVIKAHAVGTAVHVYPVSRVAR